MEKAYKEMMMIATIEILTMPLFYVIGKPSGVVFWIVLILLDSFILKHEPFFEMIKMMADKKNKKEMRMFTFMQVLYFVALAIIALHSLALAAALFLNEIVVDILCFINAMNEKNDKKDK